LITISTIQDIRRALGYSPARQSGDQRNYDPKIGFVPTMGALHEGHGALIRRARAENQYVVVSIFVNPTQFHQAEDLEKYPRTMDTDLAYCQSLGVDAVFAPTAREMYPDELLTSVEVAKISSGLCGDFRPGHFRAVATVVAKLFNIVPADRAYFGEKDAQQLAVIRKMAADLNFPIEIVPLETVREPDGLAMSSRNQRLAPTDRLLAPALYQALQAAAHAIRGGSSLDMAKQAALHVLARVPAMRTEYLEIVDAHTMQPLKSITSEVCIAAAVWLGGVRLIDNLRVQHMPRLGSPS